MDKIVLTPDTITEATKGFNERVSLVGSQINALTEWAANAPDGAITQIELTEMYGRKLDQMADTVNEMIDLIRPESMPTGKAKSN